MLRSYQHLFLTTCCSILKGTQCLAGKLLTSFSCLLPNDSPQQVLTKPVPVSELYSSRNMGNKSRSYSHFLWLGEWDLAGSIALSSHFCHSQSLNWGNGRKVFLGCSLVLKELISVETFKFYAFQGVPHSFWKWELSALQTVFHSVQEPEDELQEVKCLQTSSCTSQQAGRDFTQGFPGGDWGEGLPAFSSLLTEVT